MGNNGANEDRQYNSDVESNGVNHQNSSQNYKLKEIKKTRQSKFNKEGLKVILLFIKKFRAYTKIRSNVYFNAKCISGRFENFV